MRRPVHRHVLICEDIGIKIVLMCGYAHFDWAEWAEDCKWDHSIPETVRQVGLLLSASGIKLDP